MREAALQSEEMEAEVITITRPIIPTDGGDLLAQAQSLEIRDGEDFELANIIRNDLKKRDKRILDAFEPACKSADKAHKELTALRASAVRDGRAAIEIVDRKIIGYNRELEAERRRMQDEMNAKLAREREELALEEAQRMKAAGASQAEAEAVIEEAIAAPPPSVILPPAYEKAAMANNSIRKTWKCRDLTREELIAVCQQIAMNKIPVECVSANMSFLNQQAKSFKGNLPWPVRFYEDESLASR